MMIPLLAISLQATPADSAVQALTECQFAVSRRESERGSSVDVFQRVLSSSCQAEERRVYQLAVRHLAAQGRSADEARSQAEQMLATGRGQLVENYRRIMTLQR